MPPPHVDSAVVRIDRDPARDPATGEPLAPAMLEATRGVIEAAFAQRRKTIRNSMSSAGYAKDALDEALSATGIEPTARAETLATEDFIRLADALSQVGRE